MLKRFRGELRKFVILLFAGVILTGACFFSGNSFVHASPKSTTSLCVSPVVYVSEALVNANSDQYGGTCDKKERDFLDYLIDRLLLRKRISPPEKYNSIESWSMFGREILDEDGQE